MKTSYLENDLIKWRHEFHSHPELNFDVTETSKKVSNLLKSSNIEVHENIGRTGLVGVIKKGTSNRSIGIRADMDALPINEVNTFKYKSKHDGKMHACGHDGPYHHGTWCSKTLSRKRKV
jgi:hippurate hydrolase